MMLAHILLLTYLAAADGHTASCKLRDPSILSHSSAGLAQVSNLAFIVVECSVPTRPLPAKPGEFRGELSVTTIAYQIDQSDVRKEVPSEINISGGGQNGPQESVWFTINLPLDPADRMLEIQRWVDKLQEMSHRQYPDLSNQQAMETLSHNVSQHRAGHFQVECRVMDGDRVIGVDVLEFEVLFKGRFSDVHGPPGYWQIPPAK